MAFLTLTALVHLQKRNITHLLELTCTKSECHSNKRIVTTEEPTVFSLYSIPCHP